MGKKNKGRRGKKGRHGGEKERNEKGVRKNYVEIKKENASFEAYYKMQKIVPEGEWDQFMAACKEPLPTTFRITGSRSEAKALLHIIETRLIKEVMENDGGQADIKPLPIPWYPERMAWQVNVTRKDIRKNEAYYRFHNFLIAETESGNISRQEAVSMIPPLCLDVKPHHKVLDMCASPGSKTAQIIEMLHAEDSRPPEGYVVANDVDSKRCYMLVHQGKRLQSPAFIVTNHDAAKYPDLFITGKDGQKAPLKFDRVLCDVPCSGDGTIRKNVDVWKKWNAPNSFYLSQLQYQILKRGMEVLATNGLLVYSTCSMNPIEDEAVVLRILKEAQGSVELVDINLPQLKAVRGLSHWTICDKELNVYERVEDVVQKWKHTIRPTAFPPPPEQAMSYHLEKCVRVLPHHQNTGGFFIALLKKTKPLPWESSQTAVQTIIADLPEGTTDGTSTAKQKVPSPPKKLKRTQGYGYKEDPYIFMTEDHEIWPKITEFYGFGESLKSCNFLRRSEEGKIKNLYLTSESVRDFVINNDKTIKIVNVGVKAFARIDNKESPCNFRLSQEGLPSLAPFVKGRRAQVTKEELVSMLEKDELDKAPLLEEFNETARKQLEKISKGSMVLICDFPVDNNGPLCHWELVGWRGSISARVYVPKNDRVHYLRLCGADISKYEVNKFKDKDASIEDTNMATEKTNGNEDNQMAVDGVVL